MVVAPIAAVYLFATKQSAVYQNIYKRCVGHMSDREMLEFEC